MAEIRNAYNILVGKPKGKKPFGRPWYRWENKIRIDLRETGWEVTGCIWIRKGIVGTVLSTAMNHLNPYRRGMS
jgi:hypothetical protein